MKPLPEPTPEIPLKCDHCGARPTPDEKRCTARLGGTHYKRVVHGAGIPGHAGGFQARTCGTWVRDEGPEPRP